MVKKLVFIFVFPIILIAQAPDTLWTKTYGGIGDDLGHCVQQTSEGGYIIAGWTNSFGTGSSSPSFDKYILDNEFLIAHYICASDVDGDGYLDILGASEGDNTIAWWEHLMSDDCGDAYNDGALTPADGYLILKFFGSGHEPICCWVANVNGDGNLTTADGFHLLNHFGDPIQFPLNCAPCEF